MRRLQLLSLCAAILPILNACGGGSSSSTTTTKTTVTVMVAPTAVTLNPFGSQTFTSSVTGSSNTAVTWQVNGVTGGSSTTGTISPTGVYHAPHFISGSIIPTNTNSPVTVRVTAVSQVNPADSGSATITFLTQGQAAQTGAIELGTSGGNATASTVSGNEITCCGGTLGSLVVRNGVDYVLSNNHVLANSDAGHADATGHTGDAITQPGLIDGQCQVSNTTTVANLSEFFTLEGSPPNPVDAAIAIVASGKVNTSGNILLLGATLDANGVPVPGAPHAGSGVIPNVGRVVAKSGRSSGLTCSKIETTPATFSVAYEKTCGGGTSFTVLYSNQVGVSGGDFSQGGDSGSLIVTQDTADPVALLFAGSDTDTVGNPIEDVLLAMADASNHVPTIVGGGAHPVIGCPTTGQNGAPNAVQAQAVPDEAMQTATAARDAHAAQLLGIPGVSGVGVGSSLDYAGQPAVMIFVAPGTAHNTLPTNVDGVRTRIVETVSDSAHGILNVQDAQSLAAQQTTVGVTSLSAEEAARGRAVHSAHVADWMKQPGVQGFGVSASADSEGEVALMIFLIRGAAHGAIPAEIDGVRTRVRESSRFKAGMDSVRPQSGCKFPAAKPAPSNAAITAQTNKAGE